VCVFESSNGLGSWVLVLVGATIVGSMATVWHGVVNPPRTRQLREWQYTEQSLSYAQGAEMGRFLLGSTVVLLFAPGGLRFDNSWTAGGAVRMGAAMGQLAKA
jgi:phosphatidylserine decarboxylase